MKIFFTGATGVIGRHAVPALIQAGHDVGAVARNSDDRAWLTELGARPVEVDLFDPAAVNSAVGGSQAVIHMATSIPPQNKLTKRASWVMNDRLRTRATENLVEAALTHSAETFMQQSITFVYADGGDRWLDEDAPVDTVWDVLDSALYAERQVDRFTAEGGRGVVLRFPMIYGPGPASDAYVNSVASRKLPIVGDGQNWSSHLHVHDAGTAIVSALKAPSGCYNVSDDVPVPKGEELRALATAIGAKPPRTLPKWLAKPVLGPALSLVTLSQRVSNRRFTTVTDWKPKFGSVIEGWNDLVDRQASSTEKK